MNNVEKNKKKKKIFTLTEQLDMGIQFFKDVSNGKKSIKSLRSFKYPKEPDNA